MFAPDAPIESAKQDTLGRTSFALALARALASFSGGESFVVGIHGKWGSGKSSVLNLVVEQVENQNPAKPESDRLHILRFNPWNFADQNQLIFQFLRQFRAHLTGDKHHFKQLLGSLDDYADALAPPLELLPHGSLLSSGVKVALKGSRKLLGDSKDVNVLFEKIAAQSRKLKRRTIVLIDDIDRLTVDETRQIFQLVKLTARFPYVIYVVAFDREAVARALEHSGIDSGEEYLEKIVQVSFDIPPVDEAALGTIISTGIEMLLAKTKPAHFDQMRFGNLFHGGLRNSFQSLRDVARFLNGLEFGLGLIGPELNGVDFIGIEAIRLFYPKTFYAIRDNKKLFAGHIDTFLEKAGSKKYETEVNSVLTATNEFCNDLKDLLLELFPKLSFAYGHTIHGPSSETEWDKYYRIAAERYFDAYFALALPQSEVSVQEVGAFITISDNEAKLDEIFARWTRDGKLKKAIESVRFRLVEIPKGNLQTVLGALITLGEKASDRGVMLAGQISEYTFVRWAIFDVLDAFPVGEQATHLKSIFSRSDSLRTMANVLALIEKSKAQDSAKFKGFGDDDIRELKDIIVARVREVAKDPALLKNEALPMILGIWRDWGGSNTEPQAFLHDTIKSDVDLLHFINGFIYQRYSGSGRVLETKNRLRVEPLSQWMDLEILLGRLDNIKRKSLNDESAAILDIARSELQRFKNSGLKPQQFDNDPFMD
jgi:hypothetical protein